MPPPAPVAFDSFEYTGRWRTFAANADAGSFTVQTTGGGPRLTGAMIGPCAMLAATP